MEEVKMVIERGMTEEEAIFAFDDVSIDECHDPVLDASCSTRCINCHGRIYMPGDWHEYYRSLILCPYCGHINLAPHLKIRNLEAF